MFMNVSEYKSMAGFYTGQAHISLFVFLDFVIIYFSHSFVKMNRFA